MADESLLDVLKETDLWVDFSEAFHSVAVREMLDRATLQPRVLRCLYGLGTNAGLKRVMASDPSLNYNDLLTRRRYIHKDALREPSPALPTPPLPSDVQTFGGKARRRVPLTPKSLVRGIRIS